MNKKVRQKELLTLIQNQQIGRQEDIVAYFETLGETVTQATISRDINELSLIKVPNSHGGFHYHLPKQDDRPRLQRLKRALQQSFLSQRAQRGQIMIKVQPGNGQLIANLFEQVQFPEVFGTLSDDGSVLVLLKDGVLPAQMTNIIQKLLEK
ncbi:arginine repressor [Leuconostoc carnosum]|uniref:Arginine repressor n=2 Tax=Leuconostoc carnosum TaxID=1252 RepID=K0D7W7_LEUCJ|nr:MULTISPECIES: arginine repressor [Leuconostoc]AFT82034.1 arginine catabolic regulator [Leuconostoc carnosum JB16]KAA8325575.1 arginine repressor [Leuconostoc carnosum]KAA8328604.1 arginine repressor [Leuconostoc carnosum]KAA8359797.1 arginine repressor [Leuconostoc carnosum]KAA8365372.1 arginine repressor [Leuconostoc carnosum]